jgi:CheY-like chemotaxis protein
VSKSVLVVEDSEDDVRLLTRLLGRAGVLNPIRVVMTGHDAMCYLEGTAQYSNRAQWPLPSVIILDLKLPDIDGLQLLEWCKAHCQCRETLIVILSGHGDTTIIRKGYDLGAHSFFKETLPGDRSG